MKIFHLNHWYTLQNQSKYFKRQTTNIIKKHNKHRYSRYNKRSSTRASSAIINITKHVTHYIERQIPQQQEIDNLVKNVSTKVLHTYHFPYMQLNLQKNINIDPGSKTFTFILHETNCSHQYQHKGE